MKVISSGQINDYFLSLEGQPVILLGFFFSPNYIDHMIIFTKPLAKTYKLIGFDHWPMLLIHSTRLLHFVKLFCSFSCSLHLCTKWYWQRIINFCFWFIKLSFSLIQREIKKEIERRKTGKEMLDYKRKQEEELTKRMLEERNREKAEDRAARERIKQQIALVSVVYF